MDFKLTLTGEDVGMIRSALEIYADFYDHLGSTNLSSAALDLKDYISKEVGAAEYISSGIQRPMRGPKGFKAGKATPVASLALDEPGANGPTEEPKRKENIKEWPQDVKEGLRELVDTLRDLGWATVMRMNEAMQANKTGTIVAKNMDTAIKIIAYSMSESFCLNYGATMTIENKNRVRIRY